MPDAKMLAPRRHLGKLHARGIILLGYSELSSAFLSSVFHVLSSQFQRADRRPAGALVWRHARPTYRMEATMAVEISADMIIHDVVKQYPQTVKVFQGHGLPCTACQVGARESVAGGARTHRLDADALLADLNRVANGQEAEGIRPATKAPVGRGIPLTMAGAGAASGKIRHIIAVMSGKGGVGKSLVTGLLAVSLQRQGLKVGILDGDITGPSIAKEFGVRGMPKKGPGGIEPLRSVGGVKVMSMNMFLPEATDPVVWRGPMVASAIKQFYGDADCGQLAFLLFYLPPFTPHAPIPVIPSLPLPPLTL